MKDGYEVRGKYSEALTGEILACLDNLFMETMTDVEFLHGHERVRAIINREYVERKDQK